MRTASSVREGRISSVTLLSRLRHDSHKNRLYQALRELGRVVCHEDLFAVPEAQPFAAEAGRHHGNAPREGLEDLEAGAPSDSERNDESASLLPVGRGIRDVSLNDHSNRAAARSRMDGRSRATAEDADRGVPATESRKDLGRKVGHRIDVRAVVEAPDEEDHPPGWNRRAPVQK